MTKVVVIGGIGTAVIIAEQIYDTAKRFDVDFDFLGFAFDDESFGDSINGFPLLCKTYDVMKVFGDDEDVKFIYSLYRPDLMEVRSRLLETYGIPDERMFTFVHPFAVVARSAQIGVGNAILAHVVVNSNVRMGNNNTFNAGALVGHDSTLGNNNFCAGHVAIGSNIVMGDGNFIGLNSSLRNFIRVGNHGVIGMQSNLTKDLQDNQVVYGNPARPRAGLNSAVR